MFLLGFLFCRVFRVRVTYIRLENDFKSLKTVLPAGMVAAAAVASWQLAGPPSPGPLKE